MLKKDENDDFLISLVPSGKYASSIRVFIRALVMF